MHYHSIKAELPQNPRAAYREGWQDAITTLTQRIEAQEYDISPDQIVGFIKSHSMCGVLSYSDKNSFEFNPKPEIQVKTIP